jgi:hypothetical protein
MLQAARARARAACDQMIERLALGLQEFAFGSLLTTEPPQPQVERLAPACIVTAPAPRQPVAAEEGRKICTVARVPAQDLRRPRRQRRTGPRRGWRRTCTHPPRP